MSAQLKEILKDKYEFFHQNSCVSFFGIPIEELDKDDLRVLLGLLRGLQHDAEINKRLIDTLTLK